MGTALSAPPTAGCVENGGSITAAASGLKVTFTLAGGLASNTVVEFWLQRLPKATRRPSKGGYRVVATWR